MYRESMEILLKTMFFPFSTLECYQHDYIGDLAKTKSYKDYLTLYNKTFKTILYKKLNTRYSLHNLDYIDLVMEKYYGHSKIQDQSSEEICLHLISRLAKSFICHRNGRLALKYWESQNDESFIGPYKGINKIALWNTMNRMICTDIIVISYLLDNGMLEERFLTGFYSSIMLEDLQLEKVLSKGVAETHIHKNAGIHFNIAWQCLMNLSIDSNKCYQELYLRDFVKEQQDLQGIVASAAIGRLMLVKFLGYQAEYKTGGTFFEYLEELFKNARTSSDEDSKLIYQIVMDFSNGKIPDRKILPLSSYKEIWEYAKTRFHFTMEGKQDYVEDFLVKPQIYQTSGENIFLFCAMRHIKQNPEDFLFRKTFFQYLKLRNVVFEAKVQDNSIQGLKHFQSYYKRSTVLAGYDTVSYWKLLIKTQYQNRHLRKLEFRFGFDDKPKNLKKILIAFFTAYKEFLEDREKISYNSYEKVQPPQIGLVFHMIKQLDEEWYDKCWSNTYDLDDEQDKQKELFYSRNQHYYLKQIDILLSLRNTIPELDHFLIGIDAASIEDNTEPWVFAPVYKQARNSQDGSIQYETGQPIQTLGFTFHVGEDFRYILTGLRHVDEVLEHFSYHAGDRIGHGIVLGVDAKYWCEQNPIIMIPRGEYLDDLLWLWGICKENRGLKYLDISYLEQKIMLIAEEIFLCIDGITVFMLWKMYQEKFQCFQPDEKFNQPSGEKQNYGVFCKYLPDNCKEYGSKWSTEALLYVQHCKCYAKRLLEPIQVEVDESNTELFTYLQEMIIEKISNRGIIIETNPTSNLAIGEIKDLFNHYLFQLNDVTGNEKNHSVIISINSDDPSVFNTNVSNEISYIFYALQKKGYSREEALMWIDKIRDYGMQSSFLQDREISFEMLKKQVGKVLEKLKE